MMRMTVRVAAMAVVIGLGFQVANAGLRHFRLFQSGCAAPSCSRPSCAGPSCAVPMYVVAPPVCGCCAPVWGCSAPACSAPACSGPGCFAPGCFAPSCFQPGYGGLPLSGLNGGYGSNLYGASYDFASQPAYGSYGGSATLSAYGTQAAYGVQPGAFGINSGFGSYGAQSAFATYPVQPVAGSMGIPANYGYGSVGMFPQVSAFGGAGSGYGPGLSVPAYYAPAPAQYTPVPPAPASDLVW